MHCKFFSSLVVATAIVCPALAADPGSTLPGRVTQADVGRFIRDQNGDPIGSLKAIQGNAAVIWFGFVNTPGNHLETVPVSAISVLGGRLVFNDRSVGHVAAR